MHANMMFSDGRNDGPLIKVRFYCFLEIILENLGELGTVCLSRFLKLRKNAVASYKKNLIGLNFYCLKNIPSLFLWLSITISIIKHNINFSSNVRKMGEIQKCLPGRSREFR